MRNRVGHKTLTETADKQTGMERKNSSKRSTDLKKNLGKSGALPEADKAPIVDKTVLPRTVKTSIVNRTIVPKKGKTPIENETIKCGEIKWEEKPPTRNYIVAHLGPKMKLYNMLVDSLGS